MGGFFLLLRFFSEHEDLFFEFSFNLFYKKNINKTLLGGNQILILFIVGKFVGKAEIIFNKDCQDLMILLYSSIIKEVFAY